MAQLVARSVRDAEVVGSSPITLTTVGDEQEESSLSYPRQRSLVCFYEAKEIIHNRGLAQW